MGNIFHPFNRLMINNPTTINAMRGNILKQISEIDVIPTLPQTAPSVVKTLLMIG